MCTLMKTIMPWFRISWNVFEIPHFQDIKSAGSGLEIGVDGLFLIEVLEFYVSLTTLSLSLTTLSLLSTTFAPHTSF